MLEKATSQKLSKILKISCLYPKLVVLRISDSNRKSWNRTPIAEMLRLSESNTK
jgi:hypothetical protein